MKREEERLYIAYGSNLNLSQMEKRCPGATVVGTGEVKGYELLFRGVATIEPREKRQCACAFMEDLSPE